MTLVLSLCSALVTWHAITVVNGMSPKTRFFTRLAYIALGAGALGSAMQPWWLGKEYTMVEAMLILSVGCLVYANRRRWD